MTAYGVLDQRLGLTSVHMHIYSRKSIWTCRWYASLQSTGGTSSSQKQKEGHFRVHSTFFTSLSVKVYKKVGVGFSVEVAHVSSLKQRTDMFQRVEP